MCLFFLRAAHTTIYSSDSFPPRKAEKEFYNDIIGFLTSVPIGMLLPNQCCDTWPVYEGTHFYKM